MKNDVENVPPTSMWVWPIVNLPSPHGDIAKIVLVREANEAKNLFKTRN